jgi:hypothetical protein
VGLAALGGVCDQILASSPKHWFMGYEASFSRRCLLLFKPVLFGTYTQMLHFSSRNLGALFLYNMEYLPSRALRDFVES